MPDRKRKMSPAMREWCKLFESETGFDMHTAQGYANGDYPTFHDAALAACRWFEDHSSNAHLNITRKIPGEDKAMRERLKDR